MRYAIFFCIAATGCGLDLWTKHVIFAWRGLPGQSEVHWIIEDYFGIETALNNGALFGLGQGYTSLFAGLSIIAAMGIIAWFVTSAWVDALLTVALGGILGGIGGNLYDRLGLWAPPGGADGERIARVRDWILMCWGRENVWPNYNIADCLLVGGAALLMVHLVFFDAPAKKGASTESGKEPARGDASQPTP